MKVEYLPSFLKDLKALKSTPVFEQIKAMAFEEIPNATDLQTIVNLKKLKGDDNAYRLRVGDYRIGFYFEDETVTFARVLHRKDIYRYFPP
jgi:mRNA-degrading endonuclease RelE of RelBE toxin-antitoxin system